MEYNVRLCGAAGQGLQSVGKVLISALSKTGWHIYAHQDYESRIRGGANFFQIRISDRPLTTFSPQVDLLVALSSESYQIFADDLHPQSICFHPGPEKLNRDFTEHIFNPETVAQESGGNKRMASAVVAGLVWATVSEDHEPVLAELAEFFGARDQEIGEGNRKAGAAGVELARQLGIKALAGGPRPEAGRMVLRGNDAVALGALAAGVKYVAAYPMTPSTSITELIAAEGKKLGVSVEQAEDEIAAINMAIGAGYTGVRAMTTTSGGGFCLMTEAIGLAGSAEIPVVVVNGQRPGPSTGLPTRTEQGDLLFAVHSGHGDFPVAVLAPGSIEEAFYIMGDAFNFAEQYQIPVIVLTDQYLADSFQTLSELAPDRIKIDRGKLAEPSENYKRYQLTSDGISPRLFPGAEPAVVVSAGDEHNEEGHLIEDAETRIAMMEKRMNKLKQISVLQPVTCGETKQPTLSLITWGSTWGIVQEAVQDLVSSGVSVQGIHLPQLAPLPAEALQAILSAGPVYTVESNFSGQLATLLKGHGFTISGTCSRYDGRPLEVRQIIEYVREVQG
ncbi:MAG: 2-oxoacid:acceptor oxidoreductase subunit alpha [Firmicutes bacterium]|nr:2-oxoacid:acceptor oxidoreductase subunit alpha [Bacillota bacterium]